MASGKAYTALQRRKSGEYKMECRGKVTSPRECAAGSGGSGAAGLSAAITARNHRTALAGRIPALVGGCLTHDGFRCRKGQI